MEVDVVNMKGKKIDTVNLPDAIFDAPIKVDLMHQAYVRQMANSRLGTHSTKGRSEVSGGGRKPWRQKGTGRARHGSNRSPIWIGGGVTHGPLSEKKYGGKINKKMRAKALYTVLSEKLRNKEILFVDSINVKDAKTKEAKIILENLSKIKGFEILLSKKKNSALFALGELGDDTFRGFANFGNIYIENVKDLNPLIILKYKTLIITQPKESVKFIESKLT